MKKLFIAGCLLLITGTSAYAQKLSFGIKGGVNYSSLKTKENLTDEKNIMGYQAGIFARAGATGIYFQPELYLGTKGTEYTMIQTTAETVEEKAEVKFTTIDLPLLLGTKIGPDKLNIRFMTGPVISFKIDDKTSFPAKYNQVTDFGNYKNQAIGIQAGGGVDLGNLTLDLRYEAGLSNISESEKYNQKQNLFHLSLGFKLF